MSPAGTRRWLSAVARVSLPSFLLLVTPFVILLRYQGYSLTHPEVVAALAGLAAVSLALGVIASLAPGLGPVVMLAALMTLFADVQLDEPGEKRLALLFVLVCLVMWVVRRHAATIVSLMMATILLLSVIPSRSGAAADASWKPGGGTANLPLMLHVVLDEHIGIEGLPGDLVPPGFERELQSFYVNRGFRVFGRAYSEYPDTLWSLSQLLNLTPRTYVAGLSESGEQANMYRLLKNEYFAKLARQGYSIRVHQPEYLDVCAGGVPNAACTTYRANSLSALEGLAVPARERLRVVAGAYLARSEVAGRAKDTYAALRERAVRAGMPLPAWDWDRSPAAPLGTMPVWDVVAGELARAGRGQFYYVHLLMPHYPYMYDGRCEPRPPSEWLTRRGAPHEGVRPGYVNSPASRAARYRLYVEQLRCTARKVDGLLAAIPGPVRRDAIVIVQGDHGSRISLVDPDTAAAESPATSDYADHFSTLLAVRSPGLERGYDARPTAIACALRGLVANGFTSPPDAEACGARDVLYFWNGNEPLARPFREFWAAPAGLPATR